MECPSCFLEIMETLREVKGTNDTRYGCKCVIGRNDKHIHGNRT